MVTVTIEAKVKNTIWFYCVKILGHFGLSKYALLIADKPLMKLFINGKLTKSVTLNNALNAESL